MEKLVIDVTDSELEMIKQYVEAVKTGNDELRTELADMIALIVVTRAGN